MKNIAINPLFHLRPIDTRRHREHFWGGLVESLTGSTFEEDSLETPTSKLSALGTASIGRKRKRSSYSSEMIEMLQTAMRFQTIQLEKIAAWPEEKYKREAARRKEVLDQLKQIPDLDGRDIVKLVHILFTNVQKINGFLSVPLHWRERYCRYLLGKSEWLILLPRNYFVLNYGFGSCWSFYLL